MQGRRVPLLCIAFCESLTTGLLARAVFFYTHEVYGFDTRANLLLALVCGALYIPAAFGSGRLQARLGSRRMLAGLFVAQAGLHAALPWMEAAPAMAVLGALTVLNGLKWPVIESLLHVGASGEALGRAVGRFNLSWAAAEPVAVLLAGPLLAAWAPGVFLFATAANAVSLVILARTRPGEAPTVTDDAPAPPARPDPLLRAARWNLLAAYGLLFVMMAALPQSLERAGAGVALATAVASLPLVGRFVAFALLQRTGFWRDRAWVPAVAAPALALGFAGTLLAPGVGWVAGCALGFGLAKGLVYTFALYTVMSHTEGSVEGGGSHEGFIGIGNTLGPLAAWTGTLLLGGGGAATVVGATPVALACLAGVAWSLTRKPKTST